MKLSQDEVWEWTCNLAESSGYHPLRIIGMYSIYYEMTNSEERAIKLVERDIEEEQKNEKTNTKRKN